MVDILSAVVPLFLVVATGYLCTRAGLFQRADMAVLSRFVVKVALPLLVFVNVAGRSAAEIFNPAYLLVYALSAVAMVGLGAAYARVARRTPARAAGLGLLMAGTNNGFMGFPMFLILVPEVAGAAVGMDMLVDNIVIIPLALVLLERATHGGEGSWVRRVATSLRNVLVHPMVVAILLALLLNALGVTQPAMVGRGVTLLAQATSGTALFAVGGTLVGLRHGGLLADIVVSAVGKLLVMPGIGVAVVLGLAAAGWPLPAPLRAAAVITCALPTFSIAPALLQPYGEEELGSAAMMTQVVASAVTLTGWLLALRALGWL